LLAAAAFARDDDYVETEVFHRTVRVAFDGASAAVENSAGAGLSYSRSGAVLVFSNTIKHVAFTLTGATTVGAVKFYSGEAFKLVFDGVMLGSTNGPAVNVQSKKRCYVVLADGSANALSDGSEYGAQYDSTNGVEDAKGVLFSEGQLVFSGTGTLSVNGSCAEKHGICSDEYVRMLGGDIRVSMSKKKSDGIHVNDRFRMDGGKLSVSLALKGDGIDADDGGDIQINGGEIAVALAGDDSRRIRFRDHVRQRLQCRQDRPRICP